MTTPPESPNPLPNGSRPQKPTPAGGRDPAYKRAANWTPVLVQWFGVAGFVFEVLSAHPDPTKMGAAVTFALGGKAADVIRKAYL